MPEMTIESHADESRAQRTHVVRGDINLPDLRTFLTALYAAKDFNPEYNALWDVRAADFSHVTQPAIQELANFVRVHWAEKRQLRAAIVVSGLFHFGISRMYEQCIGPSGFGKIRIFRDFDEALSWLAKPATATPHTSP
jgi:hypothetical protein